MVLNLQDKLEELPRQTSASSLIGSREDLSHQDGNVQGSNAFDSETINLEKDIVFARAQNWCLEIEQEYNKAEVHSINTSKGDTEDVGMFSDNSEITVFEFLEAAELAYLG